MAGKHARLARWLVSALFVGCFGALAFGVRAQDLTLAPPHVDGLASRYMPVQPRLPVDPRRDAFEGSRYASEFDDGHHVYIHPYDSWRNGGLYGRRMPENDVAAVAPYFQGRGGSTINDKTQAHNPYVRRWITNLFYPYKPVGMYYDRGVYAPIYDMDYFAPGPGPFPWGHFLNKPLGG